MLEYLPIVGGLITYFAVNKNLQRRWRFCAECGVWWGEHELFCRKYQPEALPAPQPVIDSMAEIEARELALFREVPSAFWLNPARYDVPYDDFSWLDDMRYLTPPARPRVQISSNRRFDRYQGELFNGHFDQPDEFDDIFVWVRDGVRK